MATVGRGHVVLEIQLLGPVRAKAGGTAVEIGSSRQRALLAAMAVAPGQVASVDALIEALWSDDPPDGARGTLQSYVSRLRALLGERAIEHAHGGYRLAATTDVTAVERLIAEARALESQPAQAAERLADALGRWRGPALLELADQPWFLPEAVRLGELYLSVQDDLGAALLGAGRTAEAVPLLERAAAEQPVRERTQLLLVRALAQAGRAADALRAADRYRRTLAEETGLDPGPALAELEQRVLGGLPQVERTPRPPAPPAVRRSASLPRPGALVGRTEELAALSELLRVERMVTVTGTGGVGKTRLVAEVIGHVSDRTVVAVELVGTSPDDVAAAVAEALGLSGALADPIEAVVELLSVSDTLLVLDNCEHAVAPVGVLARRILDGSPGASILATSRARLGLPDEQVFPLGSLVSDGDGAPAVTLFFDRVRRAAPERVLSADELRDATELCRELEGVPLAIELAAGRAAALGVRELRHRLDQALDLLAAPTPTAARHADLRQVVGWSYGLLDDAERRVFEAISVLEGEVSLGAAEAVCAPVPGAGSVASAVARLLDTSMLQALPSGRSRMLDTVRRFGREQLAGRPWAEAVLRAHTEWAVVQLERVAAATGPGEVVGRANLRGGIEELRTALRRMETEDRPELRARFAAALAAIVIYRPEGELLGWLRRLGDAVPTEGAAPAPSIRAAAARAAYLQGDLGAARQLAGGLEIPVAQHALGVVSLYEGDHDGALDRFGAAMDHEAAGVDDRLDALGGIALAHCYAGDAAAAVDVIAAHRVLAEALDSETYRAFGDYVAGEVALACQEVPAAITLLDSAVRRARLVHAGFIVGIASTALISAHLRLGDTDLALAEAAVLVDHWWHTGTWTQQWTTLRLVAGAVADTGHPDVASLVLDAADLDSAAPALTGDDARRVARLRERLDRELAPGERDAVAAAARSLPRAVVVQRARQVIGEARSRRAAGAGSA